MRLFIAFILFSSLVSSSTLFAQGRASFGGISGGGGIEGAGEIVGFESNAILIRCPDMNIYRCSSGCQAQLRRVHNQQTALQMFCMGTEFTY
jgi:hypothetical protein